MPVLDPRVLQLVETLVASQLDWLAFELIEGIQLGDAPVESEDALFSARQDIRSLKPPTSPEKLLPSLGAVRQLEGNDQVKWAANYVASRIEASIQELGATIENFAAVVSNGQRGPKAVGVTDGSQGGFTISSVGLRGKVDRNAVADALRALPILRKELEVWRDSALDAGSS